MYVSNDKMLQVHRITECCTVSMSSGKNTADDGTKARPWMRSAGSSCMAKAHGPACLAYDMSLARLTTSGKRKHAIAESPACLHAACSRPNAA